MTVRQVVPVTAAAPSMTTPATRKRAVRSSKGGQSASASFVTLKAELHKRQNVAIRTGSGNAIASEAPGEAVVPKARRIGISVDRGSPI